jgi:hypothetical protein
MESGGSLSSKERLVLTTNMMRKRKFKLRVDELLDVGASNFAGLDFADFDNVDVAESGTVTGCHILVAGGYSGCSSQFSVLFVHVVCTRARIIPKPNTKVLDLKRLLLKDFID